MAGLDLGALEAAIEEHMRLSSIMADLAKLKAAAAEEVERLKQDAEQALAPAVSAVEGMTSKVNSLIEKARADYQAITGNPPPPAPGA